MTDYQGLVKKLNGIVGHDPKDPNIFFGPGFHTDKSKTTMYFYALVPFLKSDLQTKVKKELQKYVKSNKEPFVVTTQEHYQNSCGWYVDPFEAALDDPHVFVNKFPKDINGISIHFFNQKNYQKFKKTRKSD